MLEKITYKNYVKTIWGLKVSRKPKKFVASNAGSLDEGYFTLLMVAPTFLLRFAKNNKPFGSL